ncbi:hypothetical protein ASPZODRAFT_1740373 [Penicilliopsis zonata CBS 506.65]|uniref:tRNA-splicing endonuclease subunit Sen15 domain-containing protein n=1 Tax=Penicilliopsis zonata CBS 506.65 TaxID=1073090 RepID=A0A1L9SKR9_9EURO|nr:hypothetical protein ASPZODRAFT_1740373 [Penicilliopsis zonata CBS 506.65]OJJ47664.1 hypothetical protein ASPZODRAFT_1740373 [Penicilliopsis zonata CBS 506.65]
MMTSKTATIQAPEPSALSTLIAASNDSSPLSANTIQILHNLQHQHSWTSLQVHNLSVDEAGVPLDPQSSDTAPFPLISGIPPHRVYTHPDEQLFMLERNLRDDEIAPERTYVLPAAQGQSWSLQKLAFAFDSLPVPETESDHPQPTIRDGPENKAKQLAEYYERRKQARATQEWGGKRLLLSMVDKRMGGEGTVVYYIVQEGVVKPRQN